MSMFRRNFLKLSVLTSIGSFFIPKVVKAEEEKINFPKSPDNFKRVYHTQKLSLNSINDDIDNKVFTSGRYRWLISQVSWRRIIFDKGLRSFDYVWEVTIYYKFLNRSGKDVKTILQKSNQDQS